MMKVKKIIKDTIKESDLDIIEATLLTVEEAKQIPERLRKYNTFWWLKSVGYPAGYPSELLCNSVAAVDYKGSIHSKGFNVHIQYFAIRPVLIISNLNSSGLKIGDVFKFGGKRFEIISNDKAFCLNNIGQCAFRKGSGTSDMNEYEKSDVKKYIDEWFEKSIKESNDES